MLCVKCDKYFSSEDDYKECSDCGRGYCDDCTVSFVIEGYEVNEDCKTKKENFFVKCPLCIED